MRAAAEIALTVDRVYRADSGRILASLIASIGDFQLAQDVLHEAVALALTRWPTDGLPASPAAWLHTAARRRAIDQLRRGQSFAARSAAVATLERLRDEERQEAAATAHDDARALPDERLRLLFTCCHPALSAPAQVALTLRTLCGLQTEEIARAFLVPAPTMAQRLVRAKAKIRDAGIPYRVPDPAQLPERQGGVLAVIYLVFNEGYQASGGPRLLRHDLCQEAIRLARMLNDLMPSTPEIMGLLALMLLHDARRDARTDATGRLILLEHQDRAAYHHAEIAEGAALTEAALRLGRVGPYQIQAAVAALHAQAPRAEDTDWPQIVGLYGLLARIQPSPVVELNRAAAIAMVEGPERGLALLATLEQRGELSDYPWLPAAQADLHRRAGQLPEAIAAYHRALALTQSDPERDYYRTRLTELGAAPPPDPTRGEQSGDRPA
jgi:RNA polymerase sigma-70 factor (ECF subfamily)